MSTTHLPDRGSPRISRRQLLAAGTAAGVGVVGAACSQSPSASTVAKSTAVRPAGSDLGAVEHVIFLMMENRSFDHYYGTYPGVRGFDDHPPGDLGAFSQACPANTTSRADGTAPPLPSGHRQHRHRRLHLRPDPRLGPAAPCRERGGWTRSSGSTPRPRTKARPRASHHGLLHHGPTFPSTTPWPTPSPSATATTAR